MDDDHKRSCAECEDNFGCPDPSHECYFTKYKIILMKMVLPASPAVTTLVIKHPHNWTFWYSYPDRSRTAEENLRTIQTVSTIEDFWAVQNWIVSQQSSARA